MICLEVEPYCDDCQGFDADVIRPERTYADNEVVMSNTIVRCKYRNRCRAIKKYLERQAKSKEVSNECG